MPKIDDDLKSELEAASPAAEALQNATRASVERIVEKYTADRRAAAVNARQAPTIDRKADAQWQARLTAVQEALEATKNLPEDLCTRLADALRPGAYRSPLRQELRWIVERASQDQATLANADIDAVVEWVAGQEKLQQALTAIELLDAVDALENVAGIPGPEVPLHEKIRHEAARQLGLLGDETSLMTWWEQTMTYASLVYSQKMIMDPENHPPTGPLQGGVAISGVAAAGEVAGAAAGLMGASALVTAAVPSVVESTIWTVDAITAGETVDPIDGVVAGVGALFFLRLPRGLELPESSRRSLQKAIAQDVAKGKPIYRTEMTPNDKKMIGEGLMEVRTGTSPSPRNERTFPSSLSPGTSRRWDGPCQESVRVLGESFKAEFPQVKWVTALRPDDIRQLVDSLRHATQMDAVVALYVKPGVELPTRYRRGTNLGNLKHELQEALKRGDLIVYTLW